MFVFVLLEEDFGLSLLFADDANPANETTELLLLKELDAVPGRVPQL